MEMMFVAWKKLACAPILVFLSFENYQVGFLFGSIQICMSFSQVIDKSKITCCFDEYLFKASIIDAFMTWRHCRKSNYSLLNLLLYCRDISLCWLLDNKSW